ncbi:MAG: ATP-binding protein [Oscillospiraceae bacterium]|nr:ATP-binding protein [Oscillospiraceae bacterium]
MKRKVEAYFKWWRELGCERMPLLLYGARQIGKTYALQEFGATHYRNTIYLNFESDPTLSQLFAESISPLKLIPKIEKYFNLSVKPDDTLIIFDEIQSCNRALTSLKYFCEEAPEYHVIGAGSLLGVHITSKDYSFPVGKVITKMMHPLNFEEFLWVSDRAAFADLIEECFLTDRPVEKTLHESLLALYREYILVGGMPLAVLNYASHDKLLSYSEIQRIILDTNTSDMTKYSEKSQSIKTIMTYESIVPQLAKENKKFQYKLIKKGARASLFGDSIDWLIRAGVVLKCEKITAGNMPPNISKDVSSFKLYMGDIGLCSHRAGLTASSMGAFDQTFMGGLTENYVANTLASNGYELFYWESDSIAEVDFVIVKDGKNIPIEVKAKENTRSRSLNSFILKYNPEYAIRISGKNFGFENGIKSVPLYAAYLI